MRRYRFRMCRSITTLRRPDEVATEEEVRAAALQFVRKVSGYREPSRKNEEAFKPLLARDDFKKFFAELEKK